MKNDEKLGGRGRKPTHLPESRNKVKQRGENWAEEDENQRICQKLKIDEKRKKIFAGGLRRVAAGRVRKHSFGDGGDGDCRSHGDGNERSHGNRCDLHG